MNRPKAIGTRAAILVEARANARWSLDFVHDQFACGRRFRVLNVVDDELVVFCAPEHPLAKRGQATTEELCREAWILREQGSGTRSAMEAFFNQARFQPHLTMELQSNDAIKQAVKANLGVSFLSQHTIALELHTEQLCIWDVNDTPMVRAWTIRRGDKAPRAAGRIHSDLERTGTFECSDPLLQRFHENVVWGMRGNFVGVPTDCPQRERRGWLGDAQLSFDTVVLNTGSGAFYQKWLLDFIDTQVYDNAARLFTESATPLLLGTSDTERMRLDSSGNVVSDGSEVEAVDALFVPAAGTPRFRDTNVEVISLGKVERCVGGVIVDKHKRVVGLWASYFFPRNRERYFYGLPSAYITPVVDAVRRGETPVYRAIGAELSTISLADAQRIWNLQKQKLPLDSKDQELLEQAWVWQMWVSHGIQLPSGKN